MITHLLQRKHIMWFSSGNLSIYKIYYNICRNTNDSWNFNTFYRRLTNFTCCSCIKEERVWGLWPTPFVSALNNNFVFTVWLQSVKHVASCLVWRLPTPEYLKIRINENWRIRTFFRWLNYFECIYLLRSMVVRYKLALFIAIHFVKHNLF